MTLLHRLIMTILLFFWCCISSLTVVHSLKSGHFTRKEKELLLDLINQYRASPQSRSTSWVYPMPKASNMMQVRWDSRLEKIAQNHTDHCIFDHNTHHETSPLVRSFWRDMNDDLDDIYLGEILAFMYYDSYQDSSIQYLKKFVDYVFNYQNSEQPFDFDFCNCERGMDCTLVWSQLMTLLWAETELVGCAQTKCPGAINDHIVLCNFYPGPYFDTCPYERLYDFVNCPPSYARSTEGLCECKDSCRYKNVIDPEEQMLNDGTGLNFPFSQNSKDVIDSAPPSGKFLNNFCLVFVFCISKFYWMSTF